MRALKLAILAGLMVILAAPTSAKSDLIWGVNGHPFTAYPGIPFQQQLELVKDLGMKSYRVNISVPSQAPLLAKLVAAAKPLGIEILPVFTPALNLKTESTEQLYDRAYRMAVALISQFKDDIRVWELGNELENFAIIRACEMRDNGEQYNCSWGPAGGVDPLDYYGPRWAKVSAVLKGLSDGAMAVDPTIRKAIGTAGWGHLGAFERMHQDGIKWDISVWHTYGQDVEWALKALAKYNRPVWVTEFNNPLGSKNSEDEQVHGLVKQMKRMRELQKTYDIEAAHIYELLDESYWAPDYEAYMGLVRLERKDDGRWKIGERKPAYEAVKQLIAHAEDQSVQPPGGVVEKQVQSFARKNCNLEQLARTGQPITAEAQVEYAYCLILDREADGGGLESWRTSLQSGTSGSQLIVAMLQSDEFAEKHAVSSLDDSGFVSLVHRVLLDRDPDRRNLTAFVGQEGSGKSGRADIVKGILASDEFRSKHPILFASVATPTARGTRPTEIKRNCDLGAFDPVQSRVEQRAAYIHCLVFGQVGNTKDRDAWVANIGRGTPPWEMLATLLASTEFNDRYVTRDLDNSEFVTLLYKLLLDREPDGAGLSAYVELLDSGAMSRVGLAKALIDSSEFRAKRPMLFRVPQ